MFRGESDLPFLMLFDVAHKWYTIFYISTKCYLTAMWLYHGKRQFKSFSCTLV